MELSFAAGGECRLLAEVAPTGKYFGERLEAGVSIIDSCRAGIKCRVGDTGPGGGVVVYVASTPQTWGSFIEVAPKGWAADVRATTGYETNGTASADPKIMIDLGFDLTKATVDEAKQAIAAIKKAHDGGQFRKVAGNSYTDDLQTGEVWAAVAWSGDIANLKKDVPTIEFVLPPKGAMSFTDNAMVPVGAANSRGAAKLLDYQIGRAHV